MAFAVQDRQSSLGKCAQLVSMLLLGAALASLTLTYRQECSSTEPLPSLTAHGSNRAGAAPAPSPNAAGDGLLPPASPVSCMSSQATASPSPAEQPELPAAAGAHGESAATREAPVPGGFAATSSPLPSTGIASLPPSSSLAASEEPEEPEEPPSAVVVPAGQHDATVPVPVALQTSDPGAQRHKPMHIGAASDWNPPLDRSTVSCTDDDDDDESSTAGSRDGYRSSMARRSCIVHNICHDGASWIAFSGSRPTRPTTEAEAESTAFAPSVGETRSSSGSSTSSVTADGMTCIGRMCSGKPFVYTAPVSEADITGARGVVRVRIVRGPPPAPKLSMATASAASAASAASGGFEQAAAAATSAAGGPNVAWQPDNDVAVLLHRFMPGNLYHSLLSEIYPMYWALRRRMRHPAYTAWAAARGSRCGLTRSNGTSAGAHGGDGDGCSGEVTDAIMMMDDDAAADDYVRPPLPANTTATLLITDLTTERAFADRFAALLPHVSVARLDDLLPDPGMRVRRHHHDTHQDSNGDAAPSVASSAASSAADAAAADEHGEAEHPCSASGRCVCFRTALMGRPGITLAARNAGYIYMRSRSWADPLDAQYAVQDARDFAALLTSRALQLWPASAPVPSTTAASNSSEASATADSTAELRQASEAGALAAKPATSTPSEVPGFATLALSPPLRAALGPMQNDEQMQPQEQPDSDPPAPVPDTIVLVTREGKSGRRALLNFNEVLAAVTKRVQARMEARQRQRMADRRTRRNGASRSKASEDAALSSVAGQMRSRSFSFNFTVLPVAFERLSPGDTVRLMQRTALLVGVHGAGLTNMIHMQPGTAVLELVPPAAPYAQVLFSSLAHMLGLRHHGMPALPQDGERAEATIGELHDPVRAHADGVAALVEAILQDYDGHCGS